MWALFKGLVFFLIFPLAGGALSGLILQDERIWIGALFGVVFYYAASIAFQNRLLKSLPRVRPAGTGLLRLFHRLHEGDKINSGFTAKPKAPQILVYSEPRSNGFVLKTMGRGIILLSQGFLSTHSDDQILKTLEAAESTLKKENARATTLASGMAWALSKVIPQSGLCYWMELPLQGKPLTPWRLGVSWVFLPIFKGLLYFGRRPATSIEGSLGDLDPPVSLEDVALSGLNLNLESWPPQGLKEKMPWKNLTFQKLT